MTENSKKVFECVKQAQIEGKPVFNEVVAEMTGLSKKGVDGAFTRSIQQTGLGRRVPTEIELADGSHKEVKMFELTEAGMAFNPDIDELPTPAKA